MNDTFPGEVPNAVLRGLGLVELAASVAVGIWLASEAFAYAAPIGVAFMFQGTVVAALFFGLAAIGDNVLGIRMAVATQARDPSGLGETRRPCPSCAEPVRPHAIVCPFCRRDLPRSVYCSECGRPVEPEKAVHHDGRIWCRADYETLQPENPIG